jgi:hypothetical protein
MSHSVYPSVPYVGKPCVRTAAPEDTFFQLSLSMLSRGTISSAHLIPLEAG